MVDGFCKPFEVPEHQPVAELNQANPVSGTKYTALDTTEHARIISIMIQVTWTVQPTPLEVHMTIDGIVKIWSFTNPVSATPYYVEIQAASSTNESLSATDKTGYRAFLLEARSIKIEAETTGGTVSNLYCRVKYAKW